MRLDSIKQVVNHNLCIGCGLCALDKSIGMTVVDGMWKPNMISCNPVIDASCPSKGYDLKSIGSTLFGDGSFCPELGYYRSIHLVHSNKKSLLEKASSGGMMTAIALRMLENGKVDGVITTKYTIIDNTVRTETYIASNERDLIIGQGSKYCPTSTLSILNQLVSQKKYLLIGTPCQVAGYRLYAQHNKELQEQIPYTIANFCGGYRDFRELDFFVNKVAHVQSVLSFRHRGGGQPGSMRVEGQKGEVFQYPYPDYAKLSHFVKNERCTLCMDATGELADFSCGDAWLEDRDKTSPWSIVIARSKFASQFLAEMKNEGLITEGGIIDENRVIESQRSNITSKKYRQYKRINVRNLFFMYSPFWYDNYTLKNGSYLNELRIMLSKFKAKWLNNY